MNNVDCQSFIKNGTADGVGENETEITKEEVDTFLGYYSRMEKFETWMVDAFKQKLKEVDGVYLEKFALSDTDLTTLLFLTNFLKNEEEVEILENYFRKIKKLKREAIPHFFEIHSLEAGFSIYEKLKKDGLIDKLNMGIKLPDEKDRLQRSTD